MLVYGECECFVMQMLYVCVLCASCGSSQCCILHDLQLMLVDDAISDHTEEEYSSATSALLFIVKSRLLVYSAGSGVNRVQVVLSGFSKRLICFVQAKTLCRYGCMYFLAALVLVCVDVRGSHLVEPFCYGVI